MSAATIGQIMGLNQRKGCVFGIEVETEVDKPLPKYYGLTPDGFSIIEPPKGWKAVKDGSLRGHAMEYVSDPSSANVLIDKGLPALVNHLSPWTVDHNSLRVSTHVHMNVTDMTYAETATLASIWWALENFLVQWCGPTRVGNNFCLRAKDATRIVTNMINSVKHAQRRVKKGTSFIPFGSHYRPDDSKYSALNLCRVTDIGTFEFRTFGGLNMKDTKKFEQWVKQLEFIREMAIKIGTPRALSQMMDKLSSDDIARQFLTTDMLLDYHKLPSAIRNRMISENEVFITAIAYSIGNWDVFLNTKNKNKNKPAMDMFQDTYVNSILSGFTPTQQATLSASQFVTTQQQMQGNWANVIIDEVEDNF